ncbi:hypothetical protein A3715_19270 [Oleiphilus sp. HI0009]|nr:hypothetical protein A3715_19270 [Oleiphilus sp. HI0009]
MPMFDVIDTSKDVWTHRPISIDPRIVAAVTSVASEDSEKLEAFNDTQDIGKVCSLTLKQPICVKTSIEPEYENKMASTVLVLGGFIETAKRLGLDEDGAIDELSHLFYE